MKKVIFMSFLLAACAEAPESRFKAEFIDWCVNDGSSPAICECIFDKLDNKYGDEEFLVMEKHGVAPPNMMEDLGRYARECVSDVLRQLK